MDLPVFKERQELISNVKARYLEKGVSCVITKGSNKRRVVIKCCHGGSNDKRFARGVWRVSNVKEEHNHLILDDMGKYSTVRRLSPEEASVVREMFESGSTIKSILEHLKTKMGNKWTTIRDLSNFKTSIKKEYISTVIKRKLSEVDNHLRKLGNKETNDLPPSNTPESTISQSENLELGVESP